MFPHHHPLYRNPQRKGTNHLCSMVAVRRGCGKGRGQDLDLDLDLDLVQGQEGHMEYQVPGRMGINNPSILVGIYRNRGAIMGLRHSNNNTVCLLLECTPLPEAWSVCPPVCPPVWLAQELA